ncbi:hypothetical protein C8F04DRAFT_1232509 [Mycena alexandri]|uniref:Uncharacterized protein n=1 Tax=Mycena alexandri TaxID=1745969 RepID=A0AAD6T1J9_9AGAR|nr:hypothetical protein C8F04DRAFT_1232509 [Mycena alexandri]
MTVILNTGFLVVRWRETHPMLGVGARSMHAVLFSETGIWPIKYRRVYLALKYLCYLLGLKYDDEESQRPARNPNSTCLGNSTYRANFCKLVDNGDFYLGRENPSRTAAVSADGQAPQGFKCPAVPTAGQSTVHRMLEGELAPGMVPPLQYYTFVFSKLVVRAFGPRKYNITPPPTSQAQIAKGRLWPEDVLRAELAFSSTKATFK